MNGLFTLLPEAVTTTAVDSKDLIMGELASLFAQVYDLDRDVVLERMIERETLGSTGFGRRIAIPHARIPGLTRSVAAFMRLEAPVEFASADGIPVDLVFGLLSPDGAGAAHLHALASISRMMRDERMHEELIAAPGPAVLYSLLSNVIDRDAA